MEFSERKQPLRRIPLKDANRDLLEHIAALRAAKEKRLNSDGGGILKDNSLSKNSDSSQISSRGLNGQTHFPRNRVNSKASESEDFEETITTLDPVRRICTPVDLAQHFRNLAMSNAEASNERSSSTSRSPFLPSFSKQANLDSSPTGLTECLDAGGFDTEPPEVDIYSSPTCSVNLLEESSKAGNTAVSPASAVSTEAPFLLDSDSDSESASSVQSHNLNLNRKGFARVGEVPSGSNDQFLIPNRGLTPLRLGSSTGSIDTLLGPEPTSESRDEPLLLGNGKFKLSGKLAAGLYDHQLEGLKWLWGLHEKKRGGILGDDMGLGKTRQITCFLAGLFHSKLIKRAMVVVPTTLLAQWRTELALVDLKWQTRDFVSANNLQQRESNLQLIFERGGILLTTYDMVSGHVDSLCGESGDSASNHRFAGKGSFWDYLILDEGHLVKNPSTKRAKALKQLSFSHCILMTGTPIQNHLKELWALFDLCCEGLLGDFPDFKAEFANKITNGSDRNATNREMLIGNRAAERLREKLQPYFLRRMKSETFPSAPPTPPVTSTPEFHDAQNGAAHGRPVLPRKNDLIVWLRLTQRQRKLYRAFLQSESAKAVLNETNSPLAALTVLKKICDHPALLNENAVSDIADGMERIADSSDLEEALTHAMTGLGVNHSPDKAEAAKRGSGDDAETKKHRGSWVSAKQTGSAADEVEGSPSCKLEFLVFLLRELGKGGHRTLIFSQTRIMLDLVQTELEKERIRYCRIDGTVNSLVREQRVKEFQTTNKCAVFLLTSQVGGLGLTLTAADRVVIMDPAWNPSIDNQSVDRAYRMGQKRNVVVYRLVTAGTVEEKIYRKQIFKGGLMKTATEHRDQFRYFTHSDMREVFKIPKGGFDVSETQQQLQREHDLQDSLGPELATHVRALERRNVAGVSHHDLLFSKDAPSLPDMPEFEEQLPPVFPARNPGGIGLKARSATELHGSIADPSAKSPTFSQVADKFTLRVKENAVKESAAWLRSVKDELARQEKLLRNPAIHLPDGGAKLRKRIAELAATVQQAEAALERAKSAVAMMHKNISGGGAPVQDLDQQSSRLGGGSVLTPSTLGRHMKLTAGLVSVDSTFEPASTGHHRGGEEPRTLKARLEPRPPGKTIGGGLRLGGIPPSARLAGTGQESSVSREAQVKGVPFPFMGIPGIKFDRAEVGESSPRRIKAKDASQRQDWPVEYTGSSIHPIELS